MDSHIICVNSLTLGDLIASSSKISLELWVLRVLDFTLSDRIDPIGRPSSAGNMHEGLLWVSACLGEGLGSFQISSQLLLWREDSILV